MTQTTIFKIAKVIILILILVTSGYSAWAEHRRTVEIRELSIAICGPDGSKCYGK